MRSLARIVALFAALFATGCGSRPAEPLRAHGHTSAEWVDALRGPDVKARRRAVMELGNLGGDDPAVVPALTTALRDSDAEVRASAASALFKIGPAAQDAAAALEAATQDRDPKVRDHAAKALTRVRR